MFAGKRILAIIPAYNEEESLPSTLRELAQVRPDVDILVVDDGSTDRTAEICRSMGVPVVSLPVNLGLGGALQCGLRYAWRKGYDVAFQFDADGQHRPDQISLITEPVLDNRADIVLGSRFLNNTGYSVSKVREALMFLLKALSSVAIGQQVTDSTSGFRAYSRRAMRFMITNCSSDYTEIEAIILMTRSGHRYEEVPTGMRERTAGQSMFTPLRATYFLIRSLMAVLISVLATPRRRTAVCETTEGDN